MNGSSTLVLLAALAAGSADAAPWTEVALEDGVRVEHLAEGETPLQVFRAEGLLNASPEACLAVVSSDDFFARTVPNVAEGRIVASEGDGVRWFYARINPPFVAARDYTMRIEVTQAPSPEGAVLRMAWRIDNARGPPPRPGTVRIEQSDGAWLFSPVDGGSRARVRYELSADLGGSIPRWLARRAQLGGIMAAFDELRRATARNTP
jgi:hypothetical protein